ncbi:MAG: NADH-quinone oxidoreductase subunit H [Verrucomicrobia bacterium]|nr:NADH-quinone oxidoreductase subunit H [Verrucomicrobiota bacterium]
MTPGLLLLVAAASVALSVVLGPKCPRAWLVLLLVGAVTTCGAALMVLTGADDMDWFSTFRVGGELLHLRLDGLSALFLMLVAVIGGTGAVYATEYWSDAHYPESAPRGRAWWSGLVLSLGSVLLVSNGLHFLIAWEVFTVCAYFLVTLENKRKEVRAAGWLYLAASHVGMVFLFAFFCTLAAKTGSWELGPMREQAGLAPLFWLALLGFGVKAGIFPLHVWLPSAHANAPSHVSAIMSGVAIKMGVYGLLRFSSWLPVPVEAGPVVIGLGAISALLGIAFALAQNDIKRLLAYCSVENIGVIFIGIGAALIASSSGDALWGRLVLIGALLHVWNHGLFKALLFFCAGSVLHATGTREMSRLGGLWKTMPWTAGLFALGAVAISGLPPLNGFVSEWLVYLGLFDAVNARGALVWAAMPAVLALAVTGALALASFVKVSAIVFLGAPRTKAAAHAHDCGPTMRGPMLVLASVCIAIGLAPVLFCPLIALAVGAWNPAWAGVGNLPAPLATLGPVQATLAAVLIGASVWLWRYARRNGSKRALTWDCGYAMPTARMQYTGGSFGDIGAGWFFWILRTERKLRRPRGPFPEAASQVERVPETVLEQVIGPVGYVVMRVSTAVRHLQQGRLQSYILYLVAGLAALAVLVVLGGAR